MTTARQPQVSRPHHHQAEKAIKNLFQSIRRVKSNGLIERKITVDITYILIQHLLISLL